MESCHNSEYMGHFCENNIVIKILQCVFYWLTMFKDSHMCLQVCDR